MERQALRLELLKLTYTHAREASEAVARAKVLETYVTEGEVVQAKRRPGRQPPKADKSDPLA